MTEKYELTDEHRAQLKPWADKWIANAMSTKAMDDADRDAMRVAIRGLYEAANLVPPPDNRIVFAPSPFVAAFASGAAAWIWHCRDGGNAPHDTTSDTTDDATRAATITATYDATDAATDNATRAATSDATHDATGKSASPTWYDAGGCADAVRAIAGDGGLQCAAQSSSMRTGGNQWSGWAAFISFFRHIVKLPIDYSKWQHWEAAAIHGGPRYMHKKFCIVSDRPKTLTVDDQNRPHAENGPFCEWRDGTKLWAWHGVRVPGRLIEQPETITVKEIQDEGNEEVRRVMVDLYGPGRYLRDSGARLIDADHEGARKGAAHRALLEDDLGQRWLVGTDGSTGRTYHMAVPENVKTCRAAHESRCGFPETLILNKS